jgi:hypothetical protein
MVDRIAVAEPGGQGEGSLDVVPIGGQVATILAKVKHLADHACQHKAYFRFDGLSPMRLMGGAMVDRLAKRDPRNLSTVEPASPPALKSGCGWSRCSFGSRCSPAIHGSSGRVS